MGEAGLRGGGAPYDGAVLVLSLLSGEITEGERELVKDPFLRRGGGLRGGIGTLGAAPTNKRVVEHIESAYAHALPADSGTVYFRRGQTSHNLQ